MIAKARKMGAIGCVWHGLVVGPAMILPHIHLPITGRRIPNSFRVCIGDIRE